MKLIKKSENLVLKKIRTLEEAEDEKVEFDSEDILESDDENFLPNRESQEYAYIPLRDNPVVQSVGNTGWQVSDIWRDLRLDEFCDD
jgi:hypothetical protein